ncbi:RNase H family protein [Photobacterium ganghwense]|uniref:RNase H family protein n=1 Tax=Photobacterium ganghwense TaxID=320778 RepID=UPI0040571982
MDKQLQTECTLHNAQRPLSIYCDGSAPNHQQGCFQGGVGVAVYDAHGHCVYEYSSSVRRTDGVTNQRVELLAFICALLLADSGDCVFSDSKYCVHGYNEWLEGWKRQGWRKADKKSIAHLELWQCIDQLKASNPDVRVCYVKGHSGDCGNELADSLASSAAMQP